MDIDFEKIRQEHPLESVLGQEIPTSRKVHCPFHHESTPSLHVYPDGTWHCFGCGWGGDVLDFLAYLYHGQPAKGAILFDVLDRLGEVGVTPLSPEERERRFAEREARQRTEAEQARAARESFFLYALRSQRKLTQEHLDIFRSWAISDEWISKARLGFDGRRLTIPAFFRDVTFGIKRRRLPALDALAAPDDPKYNSVKHSSPGIYNAGILLTSQPYIVVCEDEKSALAICSQGGIAIATTGGASFWRSRKAKWWTRWLDSQPQIYFWRDADEVDVPAWQPGKTYQEGDKIIAPNRGARYFLKCVEAGESAASFPAGRLETNRVVEDGSVKWRVGVNPGLSAALDFRGWFPRVEIVDSAPYKDASEALAAGVEWQEVVL